MKTKFLCLIAALTAGFTAFAQNEELPELPVSDRTYWCNTFYKMAAPVLSAMSEGKLHEKMQVELSPTWDGRNRDVTYMECFGRLMAGLAPWLSLPDDDTPEGSRSPHRGRSPAGSR